MSTRRTIFTTAAATLWAITRALPALADAGAPAIRATLDSGTVSAGLASRGSYVITTRPSAALVRLERAALRGRPIRSLRIAGGDGSPPVELRDVTIAGWSAAEDTADERGGPPVVDVELTYDHAR